MARVDSESLNSTQPQQQLCRFDRGLGNVVPLEAIELPQA